MSLKNTLLIVFGVIVMLSPAESVFACPHEKCSKCMEIVGDINDCRNYGCCGKVDPDLGTVPLIQPLNDQANQTVTADTSAPQATFLNYYVNTVMEWLMAVAVGITALWVVVNGVTMMLFVDKQQEAKTNMMWAIGGLVLFIFFGAVLRFLNSNFFVQ